MVTECLQADSLPPGPGAGDDARREIGGYGFNATSILCVWTGGPRWSDLAGVRVIVDTSPLKKLFCFLDRPGRADLLGRHLRNAAQGSMHGLQDAGSRSYSRQPGLAANIATERGVTAE